MYFCLSAREDEPFWSSLMPFSTSFSVIAGSGFFGHCTTDQHQKKLRIYTSRGQTLIF